MAGRIALEHVDIMPYAKGILARLVASGSQARADSRVTSGKDHRPYIVKTTRPILLWLEEHKELMASFWERRVLLRKP